MNFGDVAELLMNYFYMLWKSFTSTAISGTAMGVLILSAVVFITLIWIAVAVKEAVWRVLTFRRRRSSKLAREFKARVKGKLMSAKDRDTVVAMHVQDAITDAMEELYYRGDITIEEKDAYYVKIAKAYGWDDLLRFSQLSKKEQIKAKIDPVSKHYAYKKVTLPDLKDKVQQAVGRFSGRLLKRKTA